MKTKIFISLIFSLSILSAVKGQTKFSRFFWQNLGEVIRSTAVTELSSGGYVMAGTVKDSAAGSLTDVFLAKFSSIGDTVWTRRIAAPGSEGINDVQQTNDGGFVLTGWTDSYGSIYGTILLLKTDSLGYASWAKVFSNNTTSGAEGYSVRQDADSGYVIAGNIFAPINKSLVIRTNSVGDSLWTKIYDIGYDSKAFFAQETPTGEFIAALRIDSGFLGSYVVTAKLSSSGSPVWARKVPSYNNSLNTFEIEQTIDGGYLFATEDYGSGLMILKFDNAGNFVFGKNFNRDITGYLESLDATQLADSSYRIVASFYSVTQQARNAVMLRLNQAGDTIYSSVHHNMYFYQGGCFTSDGGYASVDYSGSIYKLDSSFNMECNTSVPDAVTTFDYTCSNSLLHDSVGVIVIASGPFTNIPNIERKIYSPCTPNVPACVVTVDSATQKNLVVWEENFDTTFVDSYQVYKESAAAGVYNLIGNVPQNQLSVFLDNASNPAVQAERYRVSALWHTYYEPPNTVAGHKTIHLSISPGLPPAMNLSWSSYEGFTYPTYNIWRGNGVSASIIGSVPFGTNSYTDLVPPVGDTIYFIEVVHGTCTPTYMQNNDNGGNQSMLSSIQFNGTVSNRVNNSTQSVGINEAEKPGSIFLSPNPVVNDLSFQSKKLNIQNVEIYDIVGRLVLNCELRVISSMQTVADVSRLNTGLYFVKVKGEKYEWAGKFVKQ